MRAAIRPRAVLPARILFSVVLIGSGLFVAASLAGNIYLDWEVAAGLRYLVASVFGLGLVLLVGVGLLRIWGRS